MAENGEESNDKKKKSFGRGKSRFFQQRPGGSGAMVPKGDPVLLTNADFQWRHFLSVQDMQDASIKLKIQMMKKFLEEKLPKSENDADFFKSFPLSFSELMKNETLKSSWPSLKDELMTSTHKVLGIIGQAASENTNKIWYPRLRRFPETPMPMDLLKSKKMNQLLSVKGTVIRVANMTQMHTWLTFQCIKCDSFCSVEQKPKGRFTRPSRCPAEGCRSQTFTEMRSHPSTLTVNSQMIRLQENANNIGGKVPRSMNCHLTRDLCDSVGVGDMVNVLAVARVTTDADQSYNLYLDVVSISNPSQGKGGDKSQVEFTMLDYTAIREIFEIGPELFKLFVASLCPAIYGHELVKAGLVLSLFGGTSRFLNDSSHIPVRGDPHVLVVGDPGLGKSQMLRSCAEVAPKSVFVTATGASTTGLTVTISKGTGNEFVMEAGALVLADEGCCCIDEFDKMPNQHPALLEAMEQQSISLAKSGVSCSVKAQTAILAAANPVNGHYNRAKTVSENLKLHPALLSRFDLVFILIDRPNEELDCRLSDHIMSLHRKSKGHLLSSSSAFAPSEVMRSESLTSKLSVKPGEQIDIIPVDLMKKYIAYARKYVKPKLTSEACKVIQEFYIQLRSAYHSNDSTPITTRQLESLIRLTQARAKLNLRPEATAEDAYDVIEIMKCSMVDVFTDEIGQIDLSRSMNGSGMSKGSAKKKFVNAVAKAAMNYGKDLFTLDDLKEIAVQIGMALDGFSDVIDSLNTQGYLLKKGSNTYKFLQS